MQALQINFYLFLAVVELAAVLAGTTAFFWWRSKGVQKSSAHPDAKEDKTYAYYLDAEITTAQEVIDTATEDKTADLETTSAHKLRIKYIQLERKLLQHAEEAEQYQVTLTDGIKDLFGNNEKADTTPDETDPPDTDAPTGFAQLRNIINSQNSAVEELSKNLEGNDEIQAILKTYETQNDELIRCVDILEKDADRSSEDGAVDAPEEENSLLTMVSNQQSTIENLRTLVVKLPADENIPVLEKALDTIQQNNRELNDCVFVLEGENERLRGELEKLSSGQVKSDEAEADLAEGDPRDVVEGEIETKQVAEVTE